MKKITLVFCFLVITTSAFSQQFLWSTVEDTDFKFMPLDDVTNEVLNFYDHYTFYHDGVGYNKNSFLKKLEKYGDDSERWIDFKKTINNIEELTVIALRDNLGEGSIILIMIVSKKSVNMIGFSNNMEQDAVVTGKYKRDKFEKWFRTFLN